jgi:hypothetical protein
VAALLGGTYSLECVEKEEFSEVRGSKLLLYAASTP